MTTVLAALDASAAARPVLEVAQGLAKLAGAEVEAVHVDDGTAETPELIAARAGVAFRRLDGPVDTAVLDAMASPKVVAVVLGARATPGGRRPTGRTALRILERASKPVIVVPPDAVGTSTTLRRLVVPLEGTETSSRSALEGLCPLVVGDVDLIVLHVFTSATTPRFLDRPGRDLELLGEEFLARHCPGAARIEWRTGSIGDGVATVCKETEADLVVLSWSQDASPGHATVIRDVLDRSRVPVLLFPVGVRSGDAIVLDATAPTRPGMLGSGSFA